MIIVYSLKFIVYSSLAIRRSRYKLLTINYHTPMHDVTPRVVPSAVKIVSTI